jgi:hypothetical protein
LTKRLIYVKILITETFRKRKEVTMDERLFDEPGRFHFWGTPPPPPRRYEWVWPLMMLVGGILAAVTAWLLHLPTFVLFFNIWVAVWGAWELLKLWLC